MRESNPQTPHGEPGFEPSAFANFANKSRGLDTSGAVPSGPLLSTTPGCGEGHGASANQRSPPRISHRSSRIQFSNNKVRRQSVDRAHQLPHDRDGQQTGGGAARARFPTHTDRGVRSSRSHAARRVPPAPPAEERPCQRTAPPSAAPTSAPPSSASPASARRRPAPSAEATSDPSR